MKYFIMTLGCQMNISDSQRIASKLEQIGYKSAPEKEADLVVVNACSVRQHAVDRVWGGIKKWSKTGKTILISGCVLPADQKKFSDRNIKFFNIKDLYNLKSVIASCQARQSRRLRGGTTKQSLKDRHADARDDFSQYDDFNQYFDVPMKFSGKIAYIPIMTGCDNFCSYCAVPYTRGREVSRSMDDILIEVKDALAACFKEIWLLGQNVNSYKYNFSKLLKTVDNLDGDFKFNFMSSNPHDMSDEIIKTFGRLQKWTKELHLPLQSGDDEILRKMNRKYNSKQFLNLISVLRSKISDLRISTDVIVGFPTETKKQFENTLKICKKAGFWKVFIGQYSPRPGTVSAKMEDDVPAEEKAKRWRTLNDLINK